MIAYIIIFHLVGVILGAGGAVLSDAMFFSSIRDRKLTKTELRFMRMGSHFVWAGLAILVTTGTIIFSSNPEFYMASTKFLAKVTIVSLIILMTAYGANLIFAGVVALLLMNHLIPHHRHT
ncbi:MAG: hypothetical protein HYR90_03740 [Candidatus Andersenbacteria bacterium]|nr:hypothetical protein [Candidatus Andersenbacteria bacterium]